MSTTSGLAGLDLLSTAVLVLDPDRQVRYANPSAENLLATGARALIGTNVARFFSEPGRVSAAIDHSSNDNCSFTQHDLRLSVNGGLVAEVSCTVTPLDSPRFPGYLMELNPANQPLRLAREEQLQDQSLHARELVRNLAHEIKNPLGALRGAAQLLERELTRADLREYTQVIIQ